MSRKPSKPETRIEDYLDVMTGGNAALPQPILRIEFYYAFLAGMNVELPQPILDDEKLLAKICGMEVEAPTYIPGISPRLYAYMAKKGGQDVEVPDPILRLERYWYDYSAGAAPSVQEYTGAVPVTFVADGTPLLDYLISGNTVQNGTPTPDSPVMPEGTGERTGNIWDRDVPKYAYAQDYKKYNPDNAIALKAGTYTISSDGKLPIIQVFNVNHTQLNVDDAITHTSGYYKMWDGLAIGPQSSALRTITVTLLSDCILTFAIPDNLGTYIMLNTGSTPLPYEPYGYKLDISSANTTTPVYLGEVETTRKIKKLVLTGTENIKSGTGFLYVATNDTASYSASARCICTHYPQGGTEFCINTTNQIRFYVNSDADTFKSFLSAQYATGTPVCVWYVMTEPETAVVSEPLMRIGDYADTLSMEQAGVQIPTANGSTTLDVETTVKPSEVYIKYRGEAVATLSSLPAEVSSPEETTEEVNPEETEEEENER